MIRILIFNPLFSMHLTMPGDAYVVAGIVIAEWKFGNNPADATCLPCLFRHRQGLRPAGGARLSNGVGTMDGYKQHGVPRFVVAETGNEVSQMPQASS